ncbi:MAG: family 10 glycosylhydrolase, partial [Synechococcaceae cyanobacterium]|nr:family 10 glycosylhydrolase [Synechococcaceae cyanobacterium]
SISPNYYDFAYKRQLQDWKAWVEKGIADELLIQIYRPDLASYLPQLSRAEVMAARTRIPTAIALMSGQRNRPTPMPLIREKVLANRRQGLGTGFFYLESLWTLGPEASDERIEALRQLLAPAPGPLSAPAQDPPPPAPPPPPPPLPSPPPPPPPLP